MSKYNLLDKDNTNLIDNDPEDTLNLDRESGQKGDDGEIPEEHLIDESLFISDDFESVDEEPENPEITVPDIDTEKPEKPTVSTPPPLRTEAEEPSRASKPAAPPPPVAPEDYQDEKLSKINFKPILIGVAVVVLIAALIWAGLSFLGGDGEPETGLVKDTPEQTAAPKIDPVEQQKINAVKPIIQANRFKVNSLAGLSSLKKADITFSSILLYGNSFKFEIFSPTRDGIAKFNMNLKNNKLAGAFSLLDVVQRPGKAGGVFALYSTEISEQGKNQSVEDIKIDNQAESGLKSLFSKNKLTVQSEREIRSGRQGELNQKRVEYILTGSADNCFSLFSTIVNSGENLALHKVSMVAKNQQKPSQSSYQILLVVDYYF